MGQLLTSNAHLVEVGAMVRDDHGVSTWWAQKLVVEYEQVVAPVSPGPDPMARSRSVSAAPTGGHGSRPCTRF